MINVIDDYNREVLAIEIDTSLSSKRVTRVLDQIISWRGKPKEIRVDNGTEYTSNTFEFWSKDNGIDIKFIQPGRPMQNAYIERFNGSYRKEILDAYVFFNLDEVRRLTDQWIEEYNTRRPHEGLGNATPQECRSKIKPV